MDNLKLKQAIELEKNICNQEDILKTLNNIIQRNEPGNTYLYSGNHGTIPMESTEFLVITRLLEIQHSKKLDRLKKEFEAL